MAYGVHDVDQGNLGILENLIKNYSTSDRVYNSGGSARAYMFDSQIYQDRIKQTLFRGKEPMLPDNYSRKSLDNLVSSSYTGISSIYLLPSKMAADNYLERQTNFY